MKVLVCYDGSEGAQKALKMATQISHQGSYAPNFVAVCVHYLDVCVSLSLSFPPWFLFMCTQVNTNRLNLSL